MGIKSNLLKFYNMELEINIHLSIWEAVLVDHLKKISIAFKLNVLSLMLSIKLVVIG